MSPYLRGLRQHVGHALVMMPSAAAMVRDEAGRLLLQERSDTHVWDLPGGAVDPGEPPARALVREVYEETGLVVRPRRLVAVLGGTPEHRYRYPNGDVAEYVMILFTAEPVRGTLAPRDGESTDARFFTAAEVAEVAGPHLSAVLAAVAGQGQIPGAIFQWDDAWLDVDAGSR